MPISEKYLGVLRDVLPRNAKMKAGLVPIDLAGAIAAATRTYESYDLPKGTIRGSPAIPDEDLTTLRVPLYLVANKKLADSVVAVLAQTMMEVPRDLVGEYPLLAKISAPSTDKDAYIPIHPGAATYFSGEQPSFLDKYADKLFYFCAARLLHFDARGGMEIHDEGRGPRGTGSSDPSLQADGSNQGGQQRSRVGKC
jgi:hypothetical protein